MLTKIDITQFNENEINKIFEEYSIMILLYHYKLTAAFCIKYILDKKYSEQPNCDIYDILKYQQHLSMNDFIK